MNGETVYLGWDPGSSGAVAVVDDRLAPIGSIRLSRHTESEIVEWCRAIGNGSQVVAMLEKVRARPKQGTVSMFTFGWSYGLARGVLGGLGIPFTEVRPQLWQKSFPVPAKAKGLLRKRELKGIAQGLYPSQGIMAEDGDAWLIARYCAQNWGTGG